MADFATDNAYKGGITYSTPAFSGGAYANAAPNSGFNFDLPLASIQSFTQQALTFSAANSAGNKAFLGNVINSEQAAVAASSNRVFDFGSSSVQTISDISTMQQQQLTRRTKSGGCFITAAICEKLGLPDDCYYLQTLRKFRDENVSPELVKEYYDVAPRIVAAINDMDDAEDVYSSLRDNYLFPAIHAIEVGFIREAHFTYTEMVADARRITGV